MSNCTMGCAHGGVVPRGGLPGTEYKFAITITAEGFSMDQDDFEIKVRGRRKTVTIPKEECIVDGEGQWYFTFDSAVTGGGLITAIVTAYVPDYDFPDDLRTEVEQVDLVYVPN